LKDSPPQWKKKKKKQAEKTLCPHILEILSESNFFKNKIYLYKRLKKIIDELEKLFKIQMHNKKQIQLKKDSLNKM
jgi:hypothetical protein